MKQREKVMLSFTALLIVLLFLKSFILDPNLGQLSAEETAFKKVIYNEFETVYKDVWWRKITISRLVNIQLIEDAKRQSLKEKGIDVKYAYSGRFKIYLFGILPVYELTMMK